MSMPCEAPGHAPYTGTRIIRHTYPKQKHRPGGAVSCMQRRRSVVEQGTAWLLLMPIIGSRFTFRPPCVCGRVFSRCVAHASRRQKQQQRRWRWDWNRWRRNCDTLCAVSRAFACTALSSLLNQAAWLTLKMSKLQETLASEENASHAHR